MSKKSTDKEIKNSTGSKESKPIEAKTKFNVFDDSGWEPKNAVIYWNEKLRKWYCPKCDKDFTNGMGVSRHSQDVHGIPYKENEEPKVIKESKSSQQTSDIHTGEKASEIWRKIAEDAENGNAVDTEIIDQVFNINRQKLSKSAAEIVNNPYIMYIFAESKKKHYLSPYVDFGGFIENCVHMWISSMKIKAYFEIDMSEARINPNIAKIISENEKDWEEFKDTYGLEVPTIE